VGPRNHVLEGVHIPQNTKNVILQQDITKQNCVRCIIALSEWTMVSSCALNLLICGVIRGLFQKFPALYVKKQHSNSD